MKKSLLILAAIIVTATSLHAQEASSKKILFSVGVEPALPVGKFNNLYNFGIGGSLQGELKVAKELGITLNAGYMNYSAKNIIVEGVTVKGGSFGIVPVLAGAKYYASPNIYLHAQLGAGFGTSTGAKTDFAYSPGIGFMLTKNFDVLLKYVGYSESGTTFGSIAARVAYNF